MDLQKNSLIMPELQNTDKIPVQNINILLVDDDADDRDFFRQAVLDSGIEAELTAVEDGQELIAFLLDPEDPAAPDVIFLDLNMPGMDGKACLLEIRLQPKFSATPVIILSTSNRLKDIDETYRGGANVYISKTVFYTNSAQWIRELFPPDWQTVLKYPSRDRFVLTF